MGRYIAMNGMMGKCPDWYFLLSEADRLHCPPWELLERSVFWRDIAQKAMKAENQAAAIKKQHMN